MARTLKVLALAAVVMTAACSAVTTVRLQPETIEVGPNLRPIAGIQANATSAYFLFIPMPGVDLDQVVNQSLVVTAKVMGADKIVGLQFDVTPDTGIWALRKLLGWRSAQANGIAVQVLAPPPDDQANDGPEAPLPGDSATSSPRPAVAPPPAPTPATPPPS